MNIVYISVHAILEDDEIRMFKRLGHNVFSIGANFASSLSQGFRLPILFNEIERNWVSLFYATGCEHHEGEPTRTVLTTEFIEHFDVVIVMHDLDIVEKMWPVISCRPVVWRTIGQGLDLFELRARSLAERGMYIVRYSPVERSAPNYAGETALIRFAKDETAFGPWTGEQATILTFANLFVQRYPVESALYLASTEGISAILGGYGNDSLGQAVGMLPPEQQHEMYNSSRAYFYCSGSAIPYTLNIMEAMMTGIPVIAFDFPNRSPYYEVPQLLADGAGRVVYSVAEARATFADFLDDHSLAADVGARGRARAIELFGARHISQQWDDLFLTIAPNAR